ncbi:MAG: hypothetical protein KatS3mg023_3887 [Armatimonadota bacterium]|nr:MAG: hypothetical protein KatS3mg023_3887 [Armatimonadota bacterium]
MFPDVVSMIHEHLRSQWDVIDASLQQYGMHLRNILPYYADIGFEMMPCLMLEDISTQMDWRAIPRIGEIRQSVRLYGYVHHEKPDVRRAALVSLGVTTQIVLNRLDVPHVYAGVEFWWQEMLCPTLDFGVSFAGNTVVGAFTALMEVQSHVQLG